MQFIPCSTVLVAERSSTSLRAERSWQRNYGQAWLQHLSAAVSFPARKAWLNSRCLVMSLRAWQDAVAVRPIELTWRRTPGEHLGCSIRWETKLHMFGKKSKQWTQLKQNLGWNKPRLEHSHHRRTLPQNENIHCLHKNASVDINCIEHPRHVASFASHTNLWRFLCTNVSCPTDIQGR